jgi:hypothetical protein
MTPMCTASLFTITKLWVQPKCPSADEWTKKNVVHRHHGIPFSLKRKQNWKHGISSTVPVLQTQSPL